MFTQFCGLHAEQLCSVSSAGDHVPREIAIAGESPRSTQSQGTHTLGALPLQVPLSTDSSSSVLLLLGIFS